MALLPSPSIVNPDFDSCYSHFMPYRMAPSVRHRAIEVYYSDYYYQVTYARIARDGPLSLSQAY